MSVYKSQQIQQRGAVVAIVSGSAHDIEYLCTMINSHQHCYVECYYNFGTNDFDIKTMSDISLCRSVLLSFKNTMIMENIEIEEGYIM